MKSRRLKNKKHIKSKRVSKKVKNHHKKSKKTIRKRRNVTRKRGGRDIPLKRGPEIVTIMRSDIEGEDNWQPQPTTPPGSPDIRGAMDIVESESDTSGIEQFTRRRLYSETDEDSDSDSDSDYDRLQYYHPVQDRFDR